MSKIEEVLNFVYSEWDLGECSIRYYLVELSKRCWIEVDDFCGKRPFSKSGWKLDVYSALAEGGFIEYVKDDEGDLEDFDKEKADSIILDCFKKLQSE